LLHLSLTVLLALALAVPAMAREYAVGAPEERVKLLAEELPPAAEEDPAELLEIRQAMLDLEDTNEPLSLMSTGIAFSLDNGTQVSGDTEASGTGWTYTAEENLLVLTSEYGGGRIDISCGLTIRIEGDVTIAAPNSETYGDSAIRHTITSVGEPGESDTLLIEIPKGSSLTVTGGYGYYGGGSAISSDHDVRINSQGTVTLTGGDSYYPGYTSAGESKHAYAGHGLKAVDITLSGSGISANGGGFRTTISSFGYGGSGLFATGHVFLHGSDFSLFGGRGSYYGGYGINTKTVTVQAERVSALGGNAATCGGHGIYASGNVYLTSGSITASGGDGNTAANSGGIGGRGVATLGSFYVSATATLTGGNGYACAAGVVYGNTCNFGLANVTVQGRGQIEVFPVKYFTGATATISYHEHVHAPTSDDKTTLIVRINEYEMILDGNGGTFNGSEQLSMEKSPYPTYYDLADYPFTMSGRALMGWGSSSTTEANSNNLLPLNARVHPKADRATLYASWTSTDYEKNLIILNGLEGRLENNYLYESYANHPVTLPTELDYGSTTDALLAWSTEIVPEADEDTHIFSGQWFSGGDEITPQESIPTILYGQAESDGSYVLYHPNGGTLKDGGTLLVQGSRTGNSDLQVLTPDGSCLTAPEGLVFAGWATSAEGAVQYEGNDSLTLTDGTVTHLYACWEPPTLETVTDTGLTIAFQPFSKTVQITAPADWGEAPDAQTLIAGLFTEDGRLLQVDLGTPGTESLELTYTSDTPPVLRVFALDKTHSPAAKKTELALSSLIEPST